MLKKAPSIVDRYFELQAELFEYFGYKEDWKVIPTEARPNYYWMIVGAVDDCSTRIVWSDNPFTKESIEEGDQMYSGTIYTQRFLPKWVYRGPAHTMISVDTHTDGNKVLMIFDNDKECRDNGLMAIYLETWGSI